jgi:putative component of membrane protein insertase Oxa1/YidC/SpoIIIJ protein YidD
MRQPAFFFRKHSSIAPLSPLVDNSLLLRVVDSLAIAAISGYQRYLSPYKGFLCAHRMLHKGESCSQYVKRKVQEEGLVAAVRGSRTRFIECEEANQVIQSRRRDYLMSITKGAVLMIEDESSEVPPKKVKPHFLRGTTRKKKMIAPAQKKCNCNRFNGSCIEDSCIVAAGLLSGVAGC